MCLLWLDDCYITLNIIFCRKSGILLLYGTPFCICNFNFFFATHVVNYTENDNEVRIWRSGIVSKLRPFKVSIYRVRGIVGVDIGG